MRSWLTLAKNSPRILSAVARLERALLRRGEDAKALGQGQRGAGELAHHDEPRLDRAVAATLQHLVGSQRTEPARGAGEVPRQEPSDAARGDQPEQ
ncbi:MAG: hypothetical protein IPG04_27200 [Polyangiaceae bacterium]|nr:hypothetical protein [Polyangiaceae bacterium]